MTGIQRIAAERQRQMGSENYNEAHDDRHSNGALSVAAACYAVNKLSRENEISVVRIDPVCVMPVDAMPWGSCEDKREKHSRVRSLIIAGALIAAEIDRLARLGETE